MDNITKQKLMEKNQKIIDMVIERAKRDFPNDIAAIGLLGSFTTGEFHEKSDLDLIVLNSTDKGWGIATCYILEDVGYDLYCTSWDKIQTFSHMEILYVAKEEYRTKIEELLAIKQKELSEPIGKHCIERAKKHIDSAKQNYANVMLANDLGRARYASGELLNNIIDALSELNNDVIRKYGLKKCFETLLTYNYLPTDFKRNYMELIGAKTIQEIQEVSLNLLKQLINLNQLMEDQFTTKPTPTFDNLKGTYEELWCNYRNKMLRSTSLNDASYAFFTAIGAQNFLDEMTSYFGTKEFNLMEHFDSNNLNTIKEAFLQTMDDYLLEYKKVGKSVNHYDTFEELYNEFMKQN